MLRPVLPALALAALLGCLALGAGPAQAFHSAEGVACNPTYKCHVNLRPAEPRSADVWVDQANPARNYDAGEQSEFLVVRAGPQRAWSLVRFPLQDVPRNVSVESAYVSLQPQDLNPGRTVTMWELRTAWEEASVTWEKAQGFDTGISPVANVSINDPTGARIVFGETGGVPRGGVSGSFRKYVEGREAYYGHVLKDDAATTLNLPQVQRFRSSSDLTPEASRPLLVVSYDPNTPDIRQLLADGQQHLNSTSQRVLNLSFEVFDRRGAVIGAWINATTPEGREVFNRSVFQNRTTQFINVDRHQVWTNASLDLPEGQYILNALALDTDGNINYTEFKQANITVENRPPFVNQSKESNGALVPFLSATQLDEGQSFQAAVNASDPQSGIASVRLEVERGGEVLRNITVPRLKVDANASGDYRLTTRADVAGFLNATIWVEDRAGNLNRTARFALHVRDILDPVIDDAKVVTPARTAEGAIQEEGGVVRWEAVVRDASPLAVDLELSGPAGNEVVPMQRVGRTDTYRYERAFTARGSYGAVVVARDLDQNAAFRSGLGFFLVEAQPPAIGDLRPAASGLGAGKPTISAVVSDLNLDVQSLAMEVRVAPAPFAPVEARTLTVTDTSRRIEFEDTFFHGEQVEVRVRGADTLGRRAERAWSFTVDAKAPTTFLSTEGPALAGERTAITGATTLRLDRSDLGSGVLATVVAIVHEDRALGSGNLTLTGSGPALLNLSQSPVYGGTGNYTLFFSTVDVAGNAEATQQRRFLLDDSPPQLSVSFEPGLLMARVRENGTGVREVRATWWLAPGGQQGSSLMSPSADRTRWQAQIPDAERGSQVLYMVEAADQLGNVGRAGSASDPLRAIVQNHRPTVTLSPANGSLVRGPVTIEWAASDKDGDAVETSVAVRPSTAALARELAPRRGPSGSLAWDTRLAGDGLWVIEVTARDNFEAVVARSTVDVSNTDSKVVDFRVHAGEPGQPVRIEATLYKPVQRAEAVVRLGEAEVARVPLRDDGGPPDRVEADGVFTGSFTPQRAADYRVDLDVIFQDGRLETRDRAATAAVQYAFPARIVHDPALLALAILIPVGVVGYVLYQRYGLPRFIRRRLK